MVTALNWQPGTEAPTDQLKGSFVCETFITPQQTNSNTSNNPAATPSDDEVPCSECDDF